MNHILQLTNLIYKKGVMCKSGVCEGGCSYEEVTGCPVVEGMIKGFGIPVRAERTIVSDRTNDIIQGVSDQSGRGASRFFGSGWTAQRRRSA